ncbi:MAG: alpha/beta fold hydrolase [Deltaproteobacteria bacterium]|nr:alpha/beta fold hydrolase [Deltaproteobacteria bacterium]
MQLIHAVFEPQGDGPHPTILALHGWGANALDLLGLAPYLCSGRFLVLCPQGPVTTRIGEGMIGYGWFPLTLGRPPELAEVLSAKGQLEQFLDACAARYPIDPKKLVVLGFSQGGVMAYSLALSKPERFAALVVLSSWLTQELVDAISPSPGIENLATLVQHGSEDELIEVDRARGSIEVLRALRIPVTYREYDMGHEIGPRSLVDLSAWIQEKLFSRLIVAGV